MYSILIIEDDLTLSRGISLVLKKESFNILQAYDIKTSNERLKAHKPDLIILDVNLPDGNGLDLCKNIRRSSDVPIIFLTANDLEADILTGFELGCDDYITKPFSMIILRSRVMAVLKRYYTLADTRMETDDLVFDFIRMEFSKNGKTISLSPKEQKLLRKLITNKGHILSREQLMDALYVNDADYVDQNALTVMIRRIRHKIENDPSSPAYIKTAYGLGYIWTGGNEQCR